MNTPGQQALWKALFGDAQLPQYAHMSVTVSDTGGKLSKRERPKALRKAIKAMQNIEAGKLADVGGITSEELDSFLRGKSTPDMPAIGTMAEYLGVSLPEINIVDFSKSGYLPETMVNFLALLGWNPGDNREIMPIGELIESFDLSRLSKANSLVAGRSVVVGNAAHGLHPVAAQGFNLGLRDVAALCDCIADARQQASDDFDCGDQVILENYAEWRAPDQKKLVQFTDGIVRLFGDSRMPVRVLRNIGMLGFDLIPGVRKMFARHTMGLVSWCDCWPSDWHLRFQRSQPPSMRELCRA